MSSEPDPGTAYRSPEELTALLRQASLRLHYLNRVAIGETGFAWQLAEVIAAAGDLAALLNDKETNAAFGDGWSKGTLGDRTAKRARILELLDARMAKRG